MAGTALMVNGRAAMRNGRAIMRTSSSSCCCGGNPPDCNCLVACPAIAAKSFWFRKDFGAAGYVTVRPVTNTTFCCNQAGGIRVTGRWQHRRYALAPVGTLGCLYFVTDVFFDGATASSARTYTDREIRRDEITCAPGSDQTTPLTGNFSCNYPFQGALDLANFPGAYYAAGGPPANWTGGQGYPYNYGYLWGTAADYAFDLWFATFVFNGSGGLQLAWTRNTFNASRRATVGGACRPAACEPGGCCLPDGSCTVADPDACRLAGGVPLGPGTDCVGADCSHVESIGAAGFQFFGNQIGSGAFL